MSEPHRSDLQFIPTTLRREEEDRASEILRILAPDSEASIQSKGSDDGNGAGNEDNSRFSLFFIGSSCSLLAVVTILVSYRRRQYDQRGMHKKVETPLS